MPVLALEVKPAPLVQVVDLPVRPRARPAPEGDPLVLDPLQDRVELLVRGQEGVVVGARAVRAIEVQRQYVVDLDRREVPPGPPDRGMYLVFPASGWQIIFGSADGPGRGSGGNKTLFTFGLSTE